MDNYYYNKLVLLRVDKNFNRVLTIGPLVTIASAIAIALLLMLIYLMRHIIPTDLKVSIKISPSFLSCKGFYGFFNDAMTLNKVPPNKVILEITDEKTQILLKLIIQLSKEYGLSIVAEGVETKEQHDQLLGMDCKIIQGYYYSKPEPL